MKDSPLYSGGLRKSNAMLLQVYNNYCVFKVDVMNSIEEAKLIIEKALKDGQIDLDNEKNNVRFEESKKMLEMLRENLALWKDIKLE